MSKLLAIAKGKMIELTGFSLQLYIFGIWFTIFVAEESWLYPRFGIDGGFLVDVVQSFAYVLMGIILWTIGEYT